MTDWQKFVPMGRGDATFKVGRSGCSLYLYISGVAAAMLELGDQVDFFHDPITSRIAIAPGRTARVRGARKSRGVRVVATGFLRHLGLDESIVRARIPCYVENGMLVARLPKGTPL